MTVYILIASTVCVRAYPYARSSSTLGNEGGVGVGGWKKGVKDGIEVLSEIEENWILRQFFFSFFLFSFGIPLNKAIFNGTLFIVIAYAIKNGLSWKYFQLNQSKRNETYSIKANKVNGNELRSLRLQTCYPSQHWAILLRKNCVFLLLHLKDSLLFAKSRKLHEMFNHYFSLPKFGSGKKIATCWFVCPFLYS